MTGQPSFKLYFCPVICKIWPVMTGDRPLFQALHVSYGDEIIQLKCSEIVNTIKKFRIHVTKFFPFNLHTHAHTKSHTHTPSLTPEHPNRAPTEDNQAPKISQFEPQSDAQTSDKISVQMSADRRVPDFFFFPYVFLGQVRLGQVRLGQVRLGQVRLGQSKTVFLGWSGRFERPW